MASVSESSARANIRIEIKNDFTEEMDVDAEEDNTALSDAEVEDGEISDGKSTEDIKDNQTRKLFTNRIAASSRVENKWQNIDGSFASGIDDEKLQTRAQRFGLNPSDRKTITDEQLQDLHESLGITEADHTSTRFEAIHMYGTRDMSTQDVFDYFGKYGPSSIEWINDESCNVLWLDTVSTARAFHGLSRAVDGMPGKIDDEDTEKENKGRSILLKDREIVLSDDGKEVVNKKVDISEINIAIPPGYWRLGHPHTKAKYILLRFAKTTDKKPIKAEKFSEYSRKYGGGIRGLISESKKKRMKGIIPEEKVPKGNPWGNLAKNWNNDPLERALDSEDAPDTFQPKKVSKSILNRLGTNKRSHQPEPEEAEEEKPEPKKSKVPRMRMYADEEEERIEKVKQLKKIRELEEIEEKMAKTVPDLRNRIGRHALPPHPMKNPQIERIPEPAKLRPVRIEVSRPRSEEKEISSDNSDEDDVQVQQRSKVTVIVKKPAVAKPTVASTIWSRLDLEKRKQQSKVEDTKSESESKSESSKSDSSDSDSDSDDEEYNSIVRNKISKAVNSRPGFNRDLKSRLGLNTDHKSPLRIEINNDHYKKT